MSLLPKPSVLDQKDAEVDGYARVVGRDLAHASLDVGSGGQSQRTEGVQILGECAGTRRGQTDQFLRTEDASLQTRLQIDEDRLAGGGTRGDGDATTEEVATVSGGDGVERHVGLLIDGEDLGTDLGGVIGDARRGGGVVLVDVDRARELGGSRVVGAEGAEEDLAGSDGGLSGAAQDDRETERIPVGIETIDGDLHADVGGIRGRDEVDGRGGRVGVETPVCPDVLGGAARVHLGIATELEDQRVILYLTLGDLDEEVGGVDQVGARGTTADARVSVAHGRC